MNHIFKAGRLRILGEFAARTAVLFGVVSLVVYFLKLLCLRWSGLFYLLYTLQAWHLPLIASIAVCIAYMRLHITTVQIDDQDIIVRQGMKKSAVFPLKEYAIDGRIEASRLCNIEYVKYYLRFIDSQGGVAEIPLSFFSKTRYSDILSQANAAKTEVVPIHARSETLYSDMQSGVLYFEVPHQKLIRDAWRQFFMMLGITVLLESLLILFAVLSWNGSADFQYYFAVLACAVMIPYELIYMFLLLRNKKCCPHIIKRDGDFLFFDSQMFSCRHTEKLVMTYPNAQSHSIEPKNRYITFTADGKKFRYWLGIYGSMTVEQYKSLCDGIEQAFIMSPFKIKYKN